jgi:serine/threonine protein kinase
VQGPPSNQVSTGVQQGDILGGKYRIERVLGAGGMGVVAAATHLQLDERVAIKFLLPDALGNGEAIARFEREARAAVKIKSEHVARVIDVGTLETGAPFMVMEFLEGEDLAQRVRARGALGVQETVDFVLQACEAIAEAHSLGIVHRDLKPANLFVSRRPGGAPIVKVLDFGISKITSMSGSGQDMSMTRTTAVMGSPHYMSPEQMASTRDVDGRTDIWALGAILFELLTGKVPFDAVTVPQLCAMILQSKAPALRSRRPDCPEGLEWAVARCLEKDLSKRFANVGELSRALAEFGSRSSHQSVERIAQILAQGGNVHGTMLISPGSGPIDTRPSSQTHVAFGSTSNGQGSRVRTVMVAGAAAVLLVGGILYVFNSRAPEQTTAAGRVIATNAAAPADEPPAATAVPQAPAAAPSPEPFIPSKVPDNAAPAVPAVPAPTPAATNNLAAATARPTATSPAPVTRPRPVPNAAAHARPKQPSAAPPTPAPNPAPAGDDLGGRL